MSRDNAVFRASKAAQDAIKQELDAQDKAATLQLCKLCFGAGFVRDTAGECRWTCVCSAADNNKGETR